MSTKLYVGSLSYSTTDESLREHFAQAGTVQSASVVMDKMTGRSRGFGFVEMASDEEAKKAIETLNGKELDGRALVVNEARPAGVFPAVAGAVASAPAAVTAEKSSSRTNKKKSPLIRGLFFLFAGLKQEFYSIYFIFVICYRFCEFVNKRKGGSLC